MELNTQQVADFFGITAQAVRDRIKSGMPVKNKGGRGKGNATTFESTDVIEWYAEKKVQDRIGTSGGEEFDRQAEEARLKHHQANNERIKEEESLGRLISSRVVIEMCSAGVINCRNRMLAVNSKLRNEFPGVSEDVFERVAQLIEDALFQLGEGGIPRGLEKRISRVLEEDKSSSEANS